MADNSPEYEQMRALKLFSDEEILRMIKTRENFEYKLSQPSKTVKDYVEYIKYERSLMASAKEKVKQNKITESHTIFTLIADRMKELYSSALNKFPQNMRFWDEFIKFLQTFKYTNEISLTYDRMLQYHGEKPELWLRAITWEYKENFNDERVKSLLLRAQQRHSENDNLYLKMFQIELENKRQSMQIEALQHAEVVYISSKKKFTNIEFYLKMLNIADKYNYANSLRQKILDDMRDMFAFEEILWHSLAQRELNGLSVDDYAMDVKDLIKKEFKCEDTESKLNIKKLKVELPIQQQPTLRKRIELCCQIYAEAVQVVNTKKMWNFYLNAMLELNSDLSTQSAIKRVSLKRAFEGANKENFLSEDQYLQYIELLWSLNPKDETIEKVFHKATKIYENSVEVWKMCMRYYIQERKFNNLKEIFKVAKGLHGAKGMELWQLYLIFLKSHRSSEAQAEFERYICDLSRQPYATFNVLKAQILELLATTVSMKRARKTYAIFIKHHPYCYEVHQMMADLESKQLIRNVETERSCLDTMAVFFGKTRTDVWIRFMRFERFAGDPKNVAKIHKSAIANLKPELLDDFGALYNFFLNGVV